MHQFIRPLAVVVTLALLGTTSLAFAQTAEQTHRNRVLAMVANTITVMEQTLAMLEQTLLDLKSQVAGIGSAQTAGQTLSAEALTFKLLALQKAYEKSPSPALLTQLTVAATERNNALHAAIAADPSSARNIMLPSALTKTLPAAVLAHIEQETTLEGTLDILHEDYEDEDLSIYRHFLTTSKNERLELHFAGTAPELRGGAKVKAKGLLLKDTVPATDGTSGDVILAEEEGLLLADGGAFPTSPTVTPAVTHSLGEQRTLVILVNFQDKSTSTPWTVSEVSTMVFGNVSNFFKENSLDQTWLTGAVAGWYTIPMNSTDCSGFNIAGYAKQAAQANGYVLTNYDRFVYIFPRNTGCGYSGMAQQGAWPSGAWINGSMTFGTIAHEMGHNLGLAHSQAKDCGTTTLPVGTSTCSIQFYGDPVDVMGDSRSGGHFNGFGKERLGWPTVSNITNVTANGTYTIAPAEAVTTSPKWLKIPNGTDATGAANYYYVEYRQPIGFDAQFAGSAYIDTTNIFSGVMIRTGSPTKDDSSYLFDMTPGSNWADMKDAALTVGKSFTDPTPAITITTLVTSTSAATVSVSFGTPICAHANPLVTLTPTSQWGNPGQALTYSVKVTNIDSSFCPSSTFSVTPLLPGGWTQSPSSLSMTLAPNAYGTQSFTVTPPSTTVGGSYTISEKATNNSATTYTTTGSATYNVNAVVGDVTKPTTAITSPLPGATVTKRTTFTITASASDNVGVSRVEFWVNNKLICTDTAASYSCRWTVPGGKSTTYSIQSKAYDAAGNVGLSGVVSVVSR